jgi:hypothetical protein
MARRMNVNQGLDLCPRHLPEKEHEAKTLFPLKKK